MRIEELSAKTSKDDGTYRRIEETLLYRGGFIRGSAGNIYSTLGTMLLDNISGILAGAMEESGAKRIKVPGCYGIRGVRESMTEYMDTEVRSYRDLPSGVFSISDVLFGQKARGSMWTSTSYPVLAFVLAGAPEGAAEAAMDKCLERLGLGGMSHGDIAVFEREGEEFVCIEGTLPSEPIIGESVKAEPVSTPGIRTIAALCGFFSIGGKDILKTVLLKEGNMDVAVVVPGDLEVDIGKVSAYLDITDSSLKPMVEEDIRSITSADVGYSGPVGLKDVRILVHHGVVRGKGYVAGANRTGYHLKGVVPGRDFTGEPGDFARSGKYIDGHVLGRTRTLRESMRTAGEEGRPYYSQLRFGYLNIHRLIMALSSRYSDEKGIDLPQVLAPFEITVMPSDARNEELAKKAAELHERLNAKGLRVLLDNRNQRLGSRLFDCDLMSVKHRVIVGERPEEGFYEYKARSGEITQVNFNNLVDIIRK